MAVQRDVGSDLALIQRVLHRYMQAVDSGDIATLAERVFTEDAIIDLAEPLTTKGFCDLMAEMKAKIHTQHFLANMIAEVDGDEATTRTYFLGYHRIPEGDLGPAFDALFGRQTSLIDSLIGGICADKLRREGDDWKIYYRTITPVWQHQGPPAFMMLNGWI